jgi:hypothetical protein
LALQAQIEAGAETHLYLTDYRSLYVGWLDEVTADDAVAQSPGEAEHMPAYYRGTAADFWFRLTEVRRLVADDTVATVEALKRLRNVRYHDRPVSLYGGMVELPLIVGGGDDLQWFGDTELLTEGRLWAERDAEMRGETERMGRELRDNLLGRDVWSALEPASRTFLATAEAVYRTRRDDPRFDFSVPALEYAKAVETELNALVFGTLRKALGRARPHERMVRVRERLVDVAGPVPHAGLGELAVLLGRDEDVRRPLRAALPQDGAWLTGELPYRLQELADLRNPAAHNASARREQVSGAREQILGIGAEGLIVRIARARMRG